MANDLLNPPEIQTPETHTTTIGNPAESSTNGPSSASQDNSHQLDAFLGRAFDEKSSFASLYESIHEVFFPTKLPPLELTSTPIAVVDPMAVKRSPRRSSFRLPSTASFWPCYSGHSKTRFPSSRT